MLWKLVEVVYLVVTMTFGATVGIEQEVSKTLDLMRYAEKPWTTKACPSNSLDLLVSQWTFVLVKKKKNLYKYELNTCFILHINAQHLSQSFKMH